MFRSFRTRLAVTVVMLVGVTAALVAILSYVLVARSLRNQLVEDAVAQASFNIGVLASAEVLAEAADREAFEASGLAERFLQRGSDGLYVEFGPDADTFASNFDLVEAGSLIDTALRDLVDAGRFGYEFVNVVGDEQLVVGGRRPPAGPDFYFFFSSASIAAALSQLQRVLLIAGVGVALIGALVANRVARGVLRPVRRAGGAAEAMAAGDLSVRLPVESEDEFGGWAESFNQMAASLQARVDELQQARQREQRFVADVSHELRTPLTALVAEADMLAAHLDDMPAPARHVGEMLAKDVDRLRRLVQDLLEISRLDATAAEPSVDRVAVTPFLEAVIADRHPTATLRSTVAGVIGCDRRALERIVGNLLENAERHARGAEVAVDARLEDGLLAVDVADNGPGVPDRALPHLFDRFYSADSARQGGSGLGLAIARQHAVLLGGTVEVRHNEPSGLVFEVRLPVTQPLPAGDRPEKSSPHHEGETPETEGGPR